MNSRYWIVASIATVILAVAKSGFGGGAGVVSTPMVAAITKPQTAVAVMLPIMIICDLYCVFRYHRGCVWHLVWRLLSGFVVGTLGATVLMTYVPGQQVWLQKVIGILVVVFAVCYFGLLRSREVRYPGQMLWQRWLTKAIKAVITVSSHCFFGLTRSNRRIEDVVPQGAWFGFVMGVFAGVCSTLAHAAGPPVQAFMLSQARTQDKWKHLGTISVYAMIGNLLKVPSYLASGAMTASTLQITWPLMLIVPIGLAVGVAIHNKLNSEMFNDVVNVLLIPIGLYLLVS